MYVTHYTSDLWICQQQMYIYSSFSKDISLLHTQIQKSIGLFVHFRHSIFV